MFSRYLIASPLCSGVCQQASPSNPNVDYFRTLLVVSVGSTSYEDLTGWRVTTCNTLQNKIYQELASYSFRGVRI